DEVIAVSEKVIVKLEDLVKWTVWDSSCWKKGLHALPLKPSMLKELGKNGQRESLYRYRESTLNSGLNFKDVLREKAELANHKVHLLIVNGPLAEMMIQSCRLLSYFISFPSRLGYVGFMTVIFIHERVRAVCKPRIRMTASGSLCQKVKARALHCSIKENAL
ncbi:AT-rich interactive domain-containing protein 5B, partial [Tachysurus ichikawai]